MTASRIPPPDYRIGLAEGVRGLWTGLGPAVLRNSVINATELASYEQAKEVLLAAIAL